MNLPFLQHNRNSPQGERTRRRAERVGKLVILPVFFDLNGENVLVIGGTEAAAWKAELLAAAGANVLVHAQCITHAFKQLIESTSGQIKRRNQEHWDGDFADVKLVVCDASDASEAKKVRAIASLYGLPVNVIDQPEFCDFQFGSIVNRSPLVIGISTHGAAPILGQAVRRRIEAILPCSLGQWAAMAQSLRRTVMDHLPMGEKRRAFWERFVDQVFDNSPDQKTELQLKKICIQMANDAPADTQTAPKFTRVGYCAHDPELLTLKAVRALQSADLVVHDRHTPAAILELARREATHMDAEDFDATNDVDADFRHIVKLVAGDPCLFDQNGPS